MPHKAKRNAARRRAAPVKPKTAAPRKRRVMPVSGRGGYTSALTTLGGGIGSLFGGAGAAIGAGLGHLAGTIIGRGAYTVKRNTLAMGDGPPVFGDGAIVITHREYVGDIKSSVNFTNRIWNINPGNPDLFPWLSTIAGQFQNYQFLGLVFEFKTTSAVAVSSTNTALGTVVMATNYDSAAPAFSSKQEMEAYEFSTSTAPCTSALHPVECAPSQNTLSTLYVQTPTAATVDPRFRNLGELNLATVGMQAASNVGELWVSYHVRLSKPALQPLLGLRNDMLHLYSNSGSDAYPLYQPVAQQYGSQHGWGGGAANDIYVPAPGYYCLIFSCAANVGTPSGNCTISFGANIQAVALGAWGGIATHSGFAYHDGSGGYLVRFFKVILPGSGADNRIIITGPTGMTSGAVDAFVLSVPPIYAKVADIITPVDYVAGQPPRLALDDDAKAPIELADAVRSITSASDEYVTLLPPCAAATAASAPARPTPVRALR